MLSISGYREQGLYNVALNLNVRHDLHKRRLTQTTYTTRVLSYWDAQFSCCTSSFSPFSCAILDYRTGNDRMHSNPVLAVIRFRGSTTIVMKRTRLGG